MSENQLNDLKTKIQLLANEQSTFYKTLKRSLENVQRKYNDSIFSYFNHSIALAKSEKDKHFILGSFTICNYSNNPLSSPIILIKISTDESFDFSGKFKHPKSKEKNIHFAWERVDQEDGDPMREYWLKPISTKQLQPGETLEFNQFQLNFSSNQGKNILIEGFIYFQEIKEGLPSLNSINVSW